MGDSMIDLSSFRVKDAEYKGLCLIPIETGIKKSGTVKDILRIPYLDSIIDLSNRRNLYVCYISNSLGLVDYDTYIEMEVKNNNPLFNRILAEQIYRCCIDMFVSQVYYMGRRSEKSYRDFLDMVRYYGIEVFSPVLGLDKEIIPKMLELYK